MADEQVKQSEEQAHRDLVSPPLLWFGSILIVGLVGVLVSGNGYAFAGFLLLYTPFSVVAAIAGSIYAAKAYRGLPKQHKGRHFSTAAIVLVLLVAAFVVFVVAELSSIPAG